MGFLPEGTELPKTGGNYMKFSEGENRFRILDNAVTGYELWVGGSPIRRKEKIFNIEEIDGADINKYTNEKKMPQYFWAFPVWNYKTEQVEILQINQKKVLSGIQDYLRDADYGDDPKFYDLVVIREDGEQVSYRVKAKPPKDLDEGIKVLYKDMHINLEALFTKNGKGENPFAFNPINAEKIADEVGEGIEKIFK